MFLGNFEEVDSIKKVLDFMLIVHVSKEASN